VRHALIIGEATFGSEQCAQYFQKGPVAHFKRDHSLGDQYRHLR
jgi:hypothetical protein